ncbi:unnamed protein product [Mesocestoides corti]|uniref:DBD_Tnp_Mut domain-containing protein n=1 Tax=Mesocestoides corti TaxID=53468 RepID=A0A0R3U6B5_MESCO|nr:unnamed protein product [Mesocestoides corti]
MKLESHKRLNLHDPGILHEHEGTSVLQHTDPNHGTISQPGGSIHFQHLSYHVNTSIAAPACCFHAAKNNNAMVPGQLSTPTNSIRGTRTDCLGDRSDFNHKNLRTSSGFRREMTNSSQAKLCASCHRPALYLQHRVKLKTADDGLLGRFARYCHLKRFTLRAADKQDRAVSLPPTQTSEDSRSSATSRDRSIAYSEVSTLTSVPFLPNNDKTKIPLDDRVRKSERDKQLLSRVSKQLKKLNLVSGTGKCEKGAFAMNYHPFLYMTSPHRRRVRQEAPTLLKNPMDAVSIYASLSEVQESGSVTQCGDMTTEASGSTKSRDGTNTNFGSQHFLHFTTSHINPLQNDRAEMASKIIQRNILTRLTPYRRTCRHVPSANASRIAPQHEQYTVLRNYGSSLRSGDQPLLGRRFIKKRFYLPESANLEEILADADDRRIVAICNKFHCEMVAFTKVPRKGFMKHAIILSGTCREEIVKCARCLDARLNWCLSAQLE